MFNFLLNQRVPVRRATRGATDSVSLSWANLWSCLWPASELRAALPWLTSFYKVSRERKQSTSCAVSCCVLYPKCFLCFTVLSFNEHTLKITWTLLWNHFYRKARTHTLQFGLSLPCSIPRSGPQNIHCIFLSLSWTVMLNCRSQKGNVCSLGILLLNELSYNQRNSVSNPSDGKSSLEWLWFLK